MRLIKSISNIIRVWNWSINKARVRHVQFSEDLLAGLRFQM